jgi:hypothetical protein
LEYEELRGRGKCSRAGRTCGGGERRRAGNWPCDWEVVKCARTLSEYHYRRESATNGVLVGGGVCGLVAFFLVLRKAATSTSRVMVAPMFSSLRVSRRRFLQSASLVTAGIAIPDGWLPRTLAAAPAPHPLQQFDYGDVVLASDLHERQLEQTHSVLMGLSDDRHKMAPRWC